MLCFSVVMQSMDNTITCACNMWLTVNVIVLSDADRQLSVRERCADHCNNGLNHVVAAWVSFCLTGLMSMQPASFKQDVENLHIRLHMSLSWLHICIWRSIALQPKDIAQQYLDYLGREIYTNLHQEYQLLVTKL